MQMDQANPFRLAGIFGGVGGSLAGQVPYGVLTFGSYEMYKKSLLSQFPEVKPIFMYALAAVMGDLTGSGWLCPSEVVKQRMQAGMHGSTKDAAVSIWRSKGLVGFYEGYFGGVARDVPFRVAQLTSYEMTKNLYLRLKGRKLEEEKSKTRKRKSTAENRMELSSVEAAACGAICGTFSAAVTAPLDRIKTLLMTDSAAYGGSVASCASKIVREEGIRGLMTGVVPRVIYIAPSVVIFFVAYEQMQQRLRYF
jgi:solute carrier family 25 S-adenosylmethionine transporter 26